ncbi:MAG: LytTR family DNA-binding domain-containing protein [Dyadobacter sp.]|uniref:LytR/AlgR family response regulator transcription factor n=1 Tax=Dyadobacter sp. TaxID=1914288 RepID=UPI003263B3DD
MISPQRLRCIVVDDELVARELIEKYVARIPFLELIGVSDTAIDALFQIRQLQPDLVLLDIEMPGITGFELLKLLPSNRPAIIMITADPSYALEGYEQEVTDYLMKPVSFERFLRAVNKVAVVSTDTAGAANEAVLEKIKSASEVKSDQHNFLLLKENKKLIKVDPHEIHFIEGMKDYLKLHWSDRISVINMTMSKLEEVLSKTLFLRVNRSYIVNKDAILEIEGNEITTRNGKKVPIGVTYRSNVLASLHKNRV